VDALRDKVTPIVNLESVMRDSKTELPRQIITTYKQVN